MGKPPDDIIEHKGVMYMRVPCLNELRGYDREKLIAGIRELKTTAPCGSGQPSDWEGLAEYDGYIQACDDILAMLEATE